MYPIFLDTETTGLGPQDRLVQLAYKNRRSGEVVNELFNPSVPIPFSAMAVHHITQEMVANKPAFKESPVKASLQGLLDEGILVAHNAPYDMMILANDGVITKRFIDTCRVARHTVESESYQLQYLRYALNLPAVGVAHDALGDITILEALFDHLSTCVQKKFKITDTNEVLQKMEQLSVMPCLLMKFTFGKYVGRTYEEIAKNDRGYLEWLRNSECSKPLKEQNEDLVYTLKIHLGTLV